MDALTYKRKKNEIIQTSAAKANLEFRIEEMMEQIERVRDQIKVQEAKIEQLQAEIDAEPKHK